MARHNFIFCVLLCTSVWVFCPSTARRTGFDGAVLNGHLERVTPPFTGDTRWPDQGRPHAGSIIGRNFQTPFKDLLESAHGTPSNVMSGWNNDKHFSARMDIFDKIGGDSATKSKYIEHNRQEFLGERDVPHLVGSDNSEVTKEQGRLLVSASPAVSISVETLSGETGKPRLRSAGAGTKRMSSNAQSANSLTPEDNVRGMKTMRKPDMESEWAIIETNSGKISKGDFSRDKKKTGSAGHHVSEGADRILQTVKRLPRLLLSEFQTSARHKRIRRSELNLTLYNETETNTTDPDAIPTRSDVISYAELSNNTVGASGPFNSSDITSDERSNGSKSGLTPEGVTNGKKEGKNLDAKDNQISGTSNYTDALSTSTVSLSAGDSSTGDQAMVNASEGKLGTSHSGLSDPRANTTNVNDLSSVSNINDNDSDPPVLPSMPSIISPTTAPLEPRSGKVMITSETKSETGKTDASNTKTTPFSSTPVKTDSQTENNADKNGTEALTTSGDGSSIQMNGSQTDPWSMQSDAVTFDDINLGADIVTPVPSYKETIDDGTDKDTASSSSGDAALSSSEPRIGSVHSSSNNDISDVTNSHLVPPRVSDAKTIDISTPEPEVEPEPEDDKTSHADMNPSNDAAVDPVSESEPEPSPETEPEPESTASSGGADEDSPFPSAEPGPEWVAAKEAWQYAWEIHIYTFGILFGMVGVYTLLSVVRLWRIQRLLSRGYFLSLNSLMLALCGSRSFYLLYDGYNSNGTFPISLDYFLYSFAFPCLTSAFSILLYALLKATHMQLVSPAVQKLQVLIFIIVVHFVISIATDILIGYYAGMQVMLFVCQVYFILWGLFLFFGYAYIFRKLYSHAVKRQKNVIYTSPSASSSTSSKGKKKFTLSTAVKVTFFTAICGLVTVGLEIYAIVGVYKTFTTERPKPWPWWLYHTVLRLIEFLMCLTMSYVASQPFRYLQTERKYSCGVLCAPCAEILCCGQTINRSSSIAGWSDFDQGSNITSLHENGGSLPSGSTKKLFNSDRADSLPIVDIQPAAPGSRPNSLLIIEDGYVRFHTEHDINRVVDSYNDLSKKPEDIHNMNTFPLRDGFVNTGYSFNPDEAKSKGLQDADPSRKSSLTSAEFFRIPSSVSLADSMENELEKAFESFKLDTSVEEEDPDNRSFDFVTVSDMQNLKETDLISVDSLSQSESTSGMSSSKQQRQQQHQCKDYNDSSNQNQSPSRRPFTLLRRAKSSELSKTLKEPDSSADQYLQQKLYRSYSDQASPPPLHKNSASVKYSYLLDMETNENQVMDSEGNDLDSDSGFLSSTRRPSEGQGNQAAILTSLLKSKEESGSNDNIEV